MTANDDNRHNCAHPVKDGGPTISRTTCFTDALALRAASQVTSKVHVNRQAQNQGTSMHEDVTRTKIYLPRCEHEATMKIEHASAEHLRKERTPPEEQTKAQSST